MESRVGKRFLTRDGHEQENQELEHCGGTRPLITFAVLNARIDTSRGRVVDEGVIFVNQVLSAGIN